MNIDLESQAVALVIFFSLLGVAASILWPYANAWFSDGSISFNGRMVLGRVIGGVAAFLINGAFLVQVSEYADVVAAQGWFGYVLAFLSTFAGGYFGRETQKTPAAVGTWRTRKKGA